MEDKQEKAEKELFALYKKTKDPEIKKEITMQYLYIARTTATKLYDLYSTTMQMEDAVNEGVVAIIKGIDMYDPDKNIKFSTYITTRVRGAMLDYVRKQEWMPRGFYKQLGIIESACEDMKRELGRTPTVDELAKHLGIEKKRCQRIISMKNREISSLLIFYWKTRIHPMDSRSQTTIPRYSLRRHACGKRICGCWQKA